jgi:CubicO group peptidase (beta-lactamase class C family)
VEAVTGEPFTVALRERVLDPAGITHAYTTADEVVTRRVAAPHAVLDGTPIVLRGLGWQPGWQLRDFDVPAGGLITSAAELLRWGAVALGAAPGPLDDEHRLAMQARRRPAGGDTDAMGIGWHHADLGGVATFGHDGMTVGYLSQLTIAPDAGVMVTCLTNALGGNALTRSVRAFALTEAAGAGPVVPPVPAAPGQTGADVVGRYEDPFYDVRVVPGSGDGRLLVEEHQLPPESGRWTPPALGDPAELAWVAEDRWQHVEPEGARGSVVDVGRDATGRVVWIRRGGRVAFRLD